MKLQMTKLISWDISLGCCLPMGEHAPKGLFHSCIKLSDFTVINCKNTNFSVRTTIAQPHAGSFGKEEITLHFRVSQKSFFATSFPLFLFPVFPLEATEEQEPQFTQRFWHQWTPPCHASSNPAAAWQLCILTQSSMEVQGHQEKQAACSSPLARLSQYCETQKFRVKLLSYQQFPLWCIIDFAAALL